MKKSILFGLFLALALLPAFLFASPVDGGKAYKAAVRFGATIGVRDARLVHTMTTPDGTPTLYIYCYDNGYSVIAADDKSVPVVGFSDNGPIEWTCVPDNMRWFLESLSAEMAAVIANPDLDSKATAPMWESLLAGEYSAPKAIVVGPLINANWSQGQYYNNLCPADASAPAGTGGHTMVGCGAMVMGQVMRYWKYPQQGQGSHSYSSSNYGTLLADFANTTYQYDLMPTRLGTSSTEEQVNAVATLLYHCGVAVDMRYGPSASTANSNYMVSALTTYFRYPATIEYHERGSLSITSWMTHLKAELDSLCPFFYGASGSYGGHVFVCDGYRDDDYLHLNWGWGGNYNGYFMVGDFNPGPYDFNSSHAVIVGIRGPELPAPPAGINHPDQIRLAVYPNPATSSVTLSGLPLGTEVRLFNALGAEVLRTLYDGTPIDLSRLHNGIYLLRTPTATAKIAKQ